MYLIGGQTWKDTSETLKYLRDQLGEQGEVGYPTTESIDITDSHLDGGIRVPVMLKPEQENGVQNMYYEFCNEASRPIDWRSILKLLPTDTFDDMIGKKHVISMKLEPVIGADDRKRLDAHLTCSKWKMISERAPCPQWDFHVLFHDGSVWRFHTEWETSKASWCQVNPDQIFPPPPPNGINNYETSQDAFASRASHANADAVVESAVAEKDAGAGQAQKARRRGLQKIVEYLKPAMSVRQEPVEPELDHLNRVWLRLPPWRLVAVAAVAVAGRAPFRASCCRRRAARPP